MKEETFEDYLSEIYINDYFGIDDNMPGAFNDWLGELSVDETIIYANQYVKQALALQKKGILEKIEKMKKDEIKEKMKEILGGLERKSSYNQALEDIKKQL